MTANSYAIVLSLSDKVKSSMAEACVKTTCYKMSFFQQAILLPLLHQFKVMLRHFSMYPSIGTMARIFAPHTSLHFIACFQHIKEGKIDAPNQTVYEQAISHQSSEKKRSNEIQHCCQNCLIEQQRIISQCSYAINHAILPYGGITSYCQVCQSLQVCRHI